MRIIIAFCLAALILIPAAVVRADDTDDADAQKAALAATMAVYDKLGLSQFPMIRQAVAETNFDAATKKELTNAFAALEQQMRALLREAEQDPQSSGEAIDRGKAILRKADVEMRKSLSEVQMKEFEKQSRIVFTQVTAFANSPQHVGKLLDELEATDAQRKEVGALMENASQELEALKLEVLKSGKYVESADRALAVTIELRRKFRALLTPEQLKSLDEHSLPSAGK